MLKKFKEKFAQETIQVYENDEVIFEEGDNDRDMFIIKEGEVEVFKKGQDEDISLAVLKRGDFFGEMALLNSLPRNATVRARGKTKLLVIGPGGFLLKIRRDPTFAFEMLQNMSNRIRLGNEKLIETLSNNSKSEENLQIIKNVAEIAKQLNFGK